jgi:ATP-dependent RNA helicase DDX41
VEYVKQEAKVMYLLHCLQKRPPPAIIFSAKKGDVDDMYEYLLLKGVEVVAIHGGKDQEERDLAIKQFKAGGPRDWSPPHRHPCRPPNIVFRC